MADKGGAVVFGGGGAIGRAVLDCFVLRGVSPIISTYHSVPGPELPGVEWVHFDVSSGEGRDHVEQAALGIAAPLRGIVYAVGTPVQQALGG